MTFVPKKSLGQNFLNDKKVIKIIVDTGNIGQSDFILEVGAGTGNLTEIILEQSPKKLIVIEKDQRLALYLNEKFTDLKNSLGNIGESKLLLITSISVLDEYYETKKKIDIQKKEINKITEKFKELKSLVYNYRDLKEKEISELSKSQDNLKNEIEINRNNYETLVDKTTLELENFIKRNDPDSKIQ